MQDMKELRVWQEAKNFCLDVYSITAVFPKEEVYGITSQLRRASASIGANIAEGSGRSTQKDFAHFLHISLGSTKECEHFLIISKELGYIPSDEFKRLYEKLETIRGMLIVFIKTIKRKVKNVQPQPSSSELPSSNPHPQPSNFQR